MGKGRIILVLQQSFRPGPLVPCRVRDGVDNGLFRTKVNGRLSQTKSQDLDKKARTLLAENVAGDLD